MRLLHLLALILVLVGAANADTDTFYTRDFPQPDRAEIIAAISPSDADGPKAQVSAKDARKIAKLLRAQKWMGPDTHCDRVQYILRFYSGKKLIAEEAICFHCGCLAPMRSDLHASAGPMLFDFSTKEADALETLLSKLLPDPK